MKKILLSSLTFGLLVATAMAGLVFRQDIENDICLNRAPVQAPVATPVVAAVDTSSPKMVWPLGQIPVRTINYPSVGTLTLYGNMVNPKTFVLFLSGDGGWNLGVIDMAKTLAADGQTLLVGIDIIKYYKILQSTTEKCLYPAGDMENLSEFVQKKLNLTTYHTPILVGYSSGATLTYALLCQAPAGTFKGGVALGFCPDVQLDKPLCEGSGKLTMVHRKGATGFDFTDKAIPAAPLEVMHGELDEDCNCQATCDFFDKVKNVTVVRLPKVGHGYSVPKNWLPQFKTAFSHILGSTNGVTPPEATAPDDKLPVEMASADSGNEQGDLPLVFTKTTPGGPDALVLFLSGDGGWTGFDQQICDQLASQHIPTIGLNSQSYFWKKKTPEQTTNEIVPILRQYLMAWGKSKILLVGYSFGANIAPFIQNRLPVDLREKVEKVVMLSPDTTGDFEIRVAGMLGKGGGPYDVLSEVRSIQNTSILCVSGEEESNDMHVALQGVARVRCEKIPGSHHYNNDASKVAMTILSTK